MASSVPEKVEEHVQPILQEKNLELVDIEFVKEGKNWFLRVFIDSDTGVDLDDCTAVSEKLSEVLDSEDPIEQAYYLEVSSPGAERPLKKKEDIYKAVNKHVYVTTYAPVDGSKAFEGKLLSFDGETMIVETRDKQRKIETAVPYSQVAKARLAVAL
ncbi:ribosome maturation factor RimP [Alkalicoccus urumqiensis]|uniref:Ribosome maturation factor RimP n=1 Tax=Alkalicoccus urumqiensis TaxID=1548213 RepID=A0A2P6MG05_ALKUR|nr:ribosome maturation factor RimP [Alkalicoccus urumqiensis]PRO65193.1 ribosome maturation factor RimP [Alkalicoccus urumqiensis]